MAHEKISEWAVSFDTEAIRLQGRIGSVDEACRAIESIAAMAQFLPRDTDGSPKGPDPKGLDGEAASDHEFDSGCALGTECGTLGSLEALQAELSRTTALLKEAREVVEPFGAFLPEHLLDPGVEDEYQPEAEPPFMLGDYRRARQFLANIDKGGSHG